MDGVLILAPTRWRLKDAIDTHLLIIRVCLTQSYVSRLRKIHEVTDYTVRGVGAWTTMTPKWQNIPRKRQYSNDMSPQHCLGHRPQCLTCMRPGRTPLVYFSQDRWVVVSPNVFSPLCNLLWKWLIMVSFIVIAQNSLSGDLIISHLSSMIVSRSECVFHPLWHWKKPLIESSNWQYEKYLFCQFKMRVLAMAVN